jgi:trimeric autotransporter adhesin
MAVAVRGFTVEPLSRATGYHAHVEGRDCGASGSYAHAEGNGSFANGLCAHAEGTSTSASGASAHADGTSCTASGPNSNASGWGAVANRLGQRSRNSLGAAVPSGVSTVQVVEMSYAATTTNATVTTLTTDSLTAAPSNGTTANVYNIPFKTAGLFQLDVVARRTDVTGEVWTTRITNGFGRETSFGARILGTQGALTYADGGTTCTVTVSIDTGDATYNFLKVQVTGAVGKTISWYAHLRITELTTTT